MVVRNGSQTQVGIQVHHLDTEQALELIGADEIYKSAKLSVNGNAKQDRQANVEEEDESGVAGPELPPGEEDQELDDDEEGRFFGGGITNGQADALDFIDERDKDDMAVGTPLSNAIKLELNRI